MKKLTLSTLLIAFLLSTGLFAQNGKYTVSDIPLELLKNANSVIRDKQIRLEIPSIDKTVYHCKYAVTLLNDKSEFNALTVFYSSFNRVGKIKGKIYDANGKVIRILNKSELEDYSLSGDNEVDDGRVKYVKVNHSDYPYTIEFEYKLVYNKYMFYPTWLIQGFNTSVERTSLEVVAFGADQLDYKVLNIDLEPKTSSKNNEITYYWEVRNKAAIKSEALAPSRDKILPQVLLKPKQFKFGKYSGDTKSWASYGTFMHQLNQGRDELPKEMINSIKEMTADAATDREKIDILYNYLQKNTRYISIQLGIGGWQTFDAMYVNEKKYGDCKALTNYMKSMLKVEGITAYPVLIGRGVSDDLVMEDFVLGRFNHVILNIPSEDYWLECTSSYNPPNFIGSSNEDRKALRYTEKGGELLKTPNYKAETNQEKNKAIFTLTETGDAHLKNETILTGTQQEYYRYKKNEDTKEQLEESFVENQNLPSFSINTFEVEVNEDQPEVTILLDANIRNYASKGGKRLFVPLNLINPSVNVPPAIENRQFSLHLESDILDEDEITFILPKGYEVESIPEPSFLLETDFGSYKTEIKQNDQRIIYKRQLKLTPGDYPAERYDEYRDFRMKVGGRDSVKLVLVKKKT